MSVFTYRATNRAAAAVEGTIAADSPRQARDQLRRQGLVIEQLSESSPERVRRGGFLAGRRVSRSTVAAAIRDLSTLLAVGIPLLEALDVMLRQYEGVFRSALLSLRDRVSAGVGLADAMREQPRLYDALTVHMVDVGEQSGNLDQVLDRLAEFKEKSLQLKDRVVTALTYPALVLTSAVVVSIFLMTVVVPMLLENLTEAGRELPWPTRVLKAMSDALVEYGGLMAIVVFGLAGVLVMLVRTPRGRFAWHRLVLRVPILGEMQRKQAIARASMVIAVLMRSGIEFVRAVEIACGVTKNVVLRQALEECRRAVGTGSDIGPALARSDAFPPVVVQVFSVGQQTGQLEPMLERLSDDLERQVAGTSDRLASLIEPILILVLSVFVGFILFATVLPILEAGNVL